MSWVSLGPTNIGGCMLAIAIDPSADTRLFAIAAGGGCWRLRYFVLAEPTVSLPFDFGFRPSVDITCLGVSQWTPTTDQLPFLYMTALALCERHPHALYCVTGHYDTTWPTQVWRSDDSGLTWTQRGTPGFELAYRLAIDPDDPDRLYAATKTGLWLSVDGGLGWDVIYPGTAYDVAADPDNASIVYAGIEFVGVVKTTSARPLPDGLPFRPMIWSTVLPWTRAKGPAGAVIRIGLGTGDALTRTVAAKLDQEIFVNHQSGKGSWESKGLRGGAGQGDWDHVVAADPYDRNTLLAGAQDLFRSTDGGDSWEKVAGYATAVHPDQQFVVFDRRQRGVVYLANDGGVWSSRDSGKTWFDLNQGLVTGELFHAGVSGDIALADMYHWGLVGTTGLMTTRWAALEGGSWEFSDVYGDPVRAGRFFVFAGSKLRVRHLFRLSVPVVESTLGYPPSITVRYKEEDFGDFALIGDFAPSAIEFDVRPGSNTIVAGTAAGAVMRALDGDAATPTWNAEGGISSAGSPIAALAFCPSRPGRCWAICKSGATFSKSDVNDSGEWVPHAEARDGVLALAVNSADENRLYALHDDGIEMSGDGGGSWTWINGTGTSGLPGRGLRSVFAHPHLPALVIVSAAGGIFATTDSGVHWDRYDSGLPNADIKQVFMADGALYAATVGRGLWKRKQLHVETAATKIDPRDFDDGSSRSAPNRHASAGT